MIKYLWSPSATYSIKNERRLGPSGLDADLWRKILASSSYGTGNIDLGKAFAKVIKTICIKKIEVNSETNETSLETFLACTLFI